MILETSKGNPSLLYRNIDCLLKATDRLSGYLLNVRRGRITKLDDEVQLMKALIDQYGNFTKPPMSFEDGLDEGNVQLTSHSQNGPAAGDHVVSQMISMLRFFIPKALIPGLSYGFPILNL